jgi:pimeloyl-ACP methyl ester carboxylesterase
MGWHLPPSYCWAFTNKFIGIKIMFNRILMLALLFVCNITLCAPIKFNEYSQQKLQIEVNAGVFVALDLYKPNKQKIKALVVFSPGTGGVGDLYMDGEFRRGANDGDRKGGFVEALTQQGYAVALHWHRGLLRVEDCVKGNTLEEKRKSYASGCYLPEARKDADLLALTSDTAKVYEYLAKHSDVKSLPIISIGISQGSFHLAKLISRQEIKPKGLVLIGGLFDSYRSVNEYQLGFQYYFERINLTFEKTQQDVVSVRDVCEQTDLSVDVYDPVPIMNKLIMSMGNVTVTKADFEKRKDTLRNSGEEHIQKLLKSSPENSIGVTSGGYREYPRPNFQSNDYERQTAVENVAIYDYLKDFHGDVHYIYGQHDTLLRIPTASHCKELIPMCSLKIIDGVGHALEDQTGLPPQRSLNAMLDAVNSVYLKEVTRQ